jgi:hypothetical protein
MTPPIPDEIMAKLGQHLSKEIKKFLEKEYRPEVNFDISVFNVNSSYSPMSQYSNKSILSFQFRNTTGPKAGFEKELIETKTNDEIAIKQMAARKIKKKGKTK